MDPYKRPRCFAQRGLLRIYTGRRGNMQKIKELGQYLSQQKVPLYAANASFFLILSVFPLLVVVLAYTPSYTDFPYVYRLCT